MRSEIELYCPLSQVAVVCFKENCRGCRIREEATAKANQEAGERLADL